MIFSALYVFHCLLALTCLRHTYFGQQREGRDPVVIIVSQSLRLRRFWCGKAQSSTRTHTFAPHPPSPSLSWSNSITSLPSSFLLHYMAMAAAAVAKESWIQHPHVTLVDAAFERQLSSEDEAAYKCTVISLVSQIDKALAATDAGFRLVPTSDDWYPAHVNAGTRNLSIYVDIEGGGMNYNHTLSIEASQITSRLTVTITRFGTEVGLVDVCEIATVRDLRVSSVALTNTVPVILSIIQREATIYHDKQTAHLKALKQLIEAQVRAVCGLVFGTVTVKHVSVLPPGGVLVAGEAQMRVIFARGGLSLHVVISQKERPNYDSLCTEVAIDLHTQDRPASAVASSCITFVTLENAASDYSNNPICLILQMLLTMSHHNNSIHTWASKIFAIHVWPLGDYQAHCIENVGRGLSIMFGKGKHSRGNSPIQLTVSNKHKADTAFTVRISPSRQSRVSVDRFSFTYTVKPREPVEHDKAPDALMDQFDLCEQLIGELRF
jgi:hypothetical protein